MLTIRFQRTGRKNDPSFRIVVGEKIYSPKSGKHLMHLGSYNPKTKATVIDAEAVKEWMGKGAQLSGNVHNLFVTKGVIQGKKINVLPKKTVAKKEEEVKAEAPAPAAEAPAAEEVATEAPAQEEAPAA
jgi:small subunit ribosomal protein S16